MDQLLARQIDLLQEEDLRLRQLRPVINRFILPAFRPSGIYLTVALVHSSCLIQSTASADVVSRQMNCIN